MAGVKWSLRRRWEALGYWKKLSIKIALVSIFISSAFSAISIYLAYNPPEEITLEDPTGKLDDSGANTKEVEVLLNAIQQERNEAIDDDAVVEFINTISRIYRTIDTTATISLNEVYIDATKGQKFRSDIIIRKHVLGTEVKLLLRLNPYTNPINKSEIESFQKHLSVINASKGLLISRGKFKTESVKKANQYSIDIASFKDVKNRNWEEEILVPFLLRKIAPILSFSPSFEVPPNEGFSMPKEGNETLSDMTEVSISFNNGVDWERPIDICTNFWNTKGRLFDKHDDFKSGELIFKEEKMKVRIDKSRQVFNLKELKIKYRGKVQYLFKMVKPNIYTELRNLSTGNLIYSEYELKVEDILNQYDGWKTIDNINTHNEHYPNQAILTMFQKVSF